MKASELEWGFKDEAIEARALWGTRYIITQYGRGLDLLWDRQCIRADLSVQAEEEKKKLIKALDGPNKGDGALKMLQGYVKENPVDATSDAVFEVNLGGVKFTASPNGSHGYLYATARLTEEPDSWKPKPPEPEKPPTRCIICGRKRKLTEGICKDCNQEHGAAIRGHRCGRHEGWPRSNCPLCPTPY